MIKDLKRADPGSTEVETQVCIIGAGTAGIFLAQELRKIGIRVALLETGDEVAKSVSQHCIQKGVLYRGADYGRRFGLGATSALWGGQRGRRRWLKKHVYARAPLFLRTFLYWVYRYFILLGFLDGRAGLVFHFLQGFWYRFLVGAKLYELMCAEGRRKELE